MFDLVRQYWCKKPESKSKFTFAAIFFLQEITKLTSHCSELRVWLMDEEPHNVYFFFGFVCWTCLTFYRWCFQAATDALYVSVRVPYLVDSLSASQLHQAPQICHRHSKVSFMVALSNRIPRRVVCRIVGHVGRIHSSTGVVAVVIVPLCLY